MQSILEGRRRHTNFLCAGGGHLLSGLLLATWYGLMSTVACTDLNSLQRGCKCITGTCYNGECEGLHLPAEERAEQASWPKPLPQKVVVTAGASMGLFGKINA